jgi:hypothetical protein
VGKNVMCWGIVKERSLCESIFGIIAIITLSSRRKLVEL